MNIIHPERGIFSLVFILVLLLCSSPAMSADLDRPFFNSNLSPFIQVYGLPSARGGQLIKASSFQWQSQLDLSSNAIAINQANESIILDGESHQLKLHFLYGLSPNLEFSLDIPYLKHKSGHLDGVIDGWHDFFSLDEGVRPLQMKNQFHYFYSQEESVLVDLDRHKGGLGDISLNFGYQLSSTATRQWALRGGIKLPTGDAKVLLGSESSDIFLGINVSDQGLLEGKNITLHSSAGMLWMSKGKVLNKIRNDWVAYGSSTLSWHYRKNLSLKAQLDYHSAFYDSSLKLLGNASAQLTFGSAIQLSNHWLLDLSISEDIIVNTAPDVVFQLGLTFSP